MTDLPAICGCEVGHEPPRVNIDGTIEYCPLHAAAPAMLEALELASKYLGKAVADDLMGGTAVPVSHAFEIAERAIAQARSEATHA